MVNWNDGFFREHTPLWSSLLVKSMVKHISKSFPFDFSFNHKKSVFDRIYVNQDEINPLSHLIEDYDKKDKSFLRNVVDTYDKDVKALMEYCEELKKKRFTKITPSEFNKIIHVSMPLFAMVYTLAYCIDKHIEKKTLTSLQKEFGDKANEYLRSLSISSRKTLSTQAHEALINFAAEGKDIKEKANLLADKYGWLNMRHFKGNLFSSEDYEKRINELIKKDAKKVLSKYKSQQKKLKNEAEKVISQIKDPELKEFVKTLQDFIYIRTQKKDALTYYGFCLLPTLKVIANQLGISDPIYLSYWEILDGLENNKKFDENTILRRKQGFHDFYEGGKYTIFDKDDYKSLIEEKKIDDVSELKGTIACKGKVKGPVIVILRKEHLEKMKKDHILVATMTTPEFISAIEKSIAIVTDEGGLTSHAAIISRELNKPCIIGTKIATKVLKDNDIVEVDAEKGIVRKL